jgi:hypothetical protein
MINGCYFNNGTSIRLITDDSFTEYGRIISFPSEEAVSYIAKHAKMPEQDNEYAPDDEGLRSLPLIANIQRQVFGELDIQAGWCVGNLNKMNAMEWHKSSEVIIAATNMVLLLGSYRSIVCDTYDSSDATAFYLKKGQIVELFPMVLHFAPLNIGGGFKAGIILPANTNTALDNGIDGTLRAKNKWLLVHPEFEKGIRSGGKIGITGDNLELRYEKK